MLKEIKIAHVKKQIGFKTILSDVSLTIKPGEIVVITGPNGAGKTTFLRIIAGLTPKTAGEIFWDDEKFSPKKAELLSQIGILGHRPMVYESLSALDNLIFFSKMHNCFEKARVNELLRWVGLNYYKHERVSTFSRGMLQRLGLARMLIHSPQVLLYDEPFTGLDAAGQRLLLTTLKAMQDEGKIQILITHNLEELAGLNYREVRLDGGRLLSDAGEHGGETPSIDEITQPTSRTDQLVGGLQLAANVNGSAAVASQLAKEVKQECVQSDRDSEGDLNAEVERQPLSSTVPVDHQSKLEIAHESVQLVRTAVREVLGQFGEDSAAVERMVQDFHRSAEDSLDGQDSEEVSLIKQMIRQSESESIYVNEYLVERESNARTSGDEAKGEMREHSC